MNDFNSIRYQPNNPKHEINADAQINGIVYNICDKLISTGCRLHTNNHQVECHSLTFTKKNTLQKVMFMSNWGLCRKTHTSRASGCYKYRTRFSFSSSSAFQLRYLGLNLLWCDIWTACYSYFCYTLYYSTRWRIYIICVEKYLHILVIVSYSYWASC